MTINFTIPPRADLPRISTDLFIDNPVTNQTETLGVVYHPDSTEIPRPTPVEPIYPTSGGLSVSDIILIIIALVVFIALLYSMKAPSNRAAPPAQSGYYGSQFGSYQVPSSGVGSTYGTPSNNNFIVYNF